MSARQLENTRQGCPVDPKASCVLVGNGPSATRVKLGKVIDAFDEVVRFNQYAISGYEDFLGTKTTIYSTFGKKMVPNDPSRPSKIIFIHDHNGDPAWVAESIWRIPLDFFWAVMEQFNSPDNLKRNGKGKALPSSGYLVAAWLLSNGVERLYFYGFDHFAKHDGGRQHHYWIPRSFKTPPEHNGAFESMKFAEWMAEGRAFYLG